MLCEELLQTSEPVARGRCVGDCGPKEMAEDQFFALAEEYLARQAGKTEVVEWLVHHGATLDCRDAFQMTPIIHACIGGNVDTVRRLIEFGARVDLVDNQNMSALDICKCEWTPIVACIRKKEDCIPLIEEALEKKQLRCCNPKCGKPGKRSTLKLCARCKLTRYCSRECQKQHWLVGHMKCCGQDEFSGPVPCDKHTIKYEILNAVIEAKSGKPLDYWITLNAAHRS